MELSFREEEGEMNKRVVSLIESLSKRWFWENHVIRGHGFIKVGI